MKDIPKQLAVIAWTPYATWESISKSALEKDPEEVKEST